METLKKFFPYSFKKTETAADLVVTIILYLVAAIVIGAVLSLAMLLLAFIPVVGLILCWLLGVVSSLLGLYVLAGIVIAILVFAKVIKE